MKIKKEDVEDIYALTELQEGMLYYYLKDQNNEYNEQIIIRLRGKISVELFAKSCQMLVDQYEVLRTVFIYEGVSQHIQVVLKQPVVEINNMVLDDLSKSENELQEYCKRDYEKKFDLTKNAVRFSLIEIMKDEYAVVITNHHIIYDGWSNGIILEKLFHIYSCLIGGTVVTSVKNTPFKQYVLWSLERNRLREMNYWNEYLDGYQPFLKTSNVKGDISQEYCAKFDKEPLVKFARDEKVTMATVLYAAWGILLQKIYRRDDIIFGITVSGRDIEGHDLSQSVGLFINTIPIRFHYNKSIITKELLVRVQEDIIEKKKNEHTFMVDIKKAANIEGYDELFNSIIVIENYPLEKIKLNDFEILGYTTRESNNYDLTIGVEFSDGIKIVFSYKKNIYKENEIKSLAESYINIINQIIFHINSPVSEIELLGVKEKEDIYERCNKFSDVETTQEQNILECFEDMVDTYPNNIAIIHGKRKITYRELDHRSTELAEALFLEHISEEKIIPIMMDHSMEMIVAMIAVIKVGASFTLLDDTMPVNRLKQILNNCQANYIISDCQRDGYTQKVFIYNERSVLEKNHNMTKNKIKPSDLLYIIFTSGTTGTPQGVLIEHRNLISYVVAVTELLNITEKDSTIQLCSVTFDTFIDEVFLALLNGGRFVVSSRDTIRNVKKLHTLIKENNISILSCAPMLLNEFNSMEILDCVRVIISGGDVLRYNHISNYIDRAEVYNSYGPSEATIAPMYYRLKKEDEKRIIPIGKPISGMVAYVLDNDYKMCNYGMIGEIYLGGRSISRGYLNNPELTEKRFLKLKVRDSFEYLYRTHDLAIILEDGSLEFVGRDDGQVKINGIRIELHEIETYISNHPKVSEVVVVVQEKNKIKKQLCAFYTLNDKLDANELKSYVEKFIPQTMLPTMWIELDSIPLSRHGKIQYDTLNQYYEKECEKRVASLELPQNAQEQEIFKLWCKVLPDKKFGVTDDFFEIGGNSLELVSLYTLIKKQVYEEATVQDLFDYRNIRDFVKHFEYSDKKKEVINILDF